MTPHEKLRAVEDLLKHPGWLLFKEFLDQEVAKSVDHLVEPKVQNDNSICFLRGATWATLKLPSLPEKLRDILAADVAITTTEEDS